MQIGTIIEVVEFPKRIIPIELPSKGNEEEAIPAPDIFQPKPAAIPVDVPKKE